MREMFNKESSKKIIASLVPFVLGLILVLLFVLKSLNPLIWGLIGSLFVFSCIVSIWVNNQNFLSLIVIFVYQIVLKIPLHFKNLLYVFQPDEAYHLGYSMILSFNQQSLPVERMIGYTPFPILDLIVSKLILAIGFSNTIIAVKIVNSILVGLITVYLADKTFQIVFREKKRLATFIFASCYKFLFFSSLYVYEALTFMLFVFATYIIVSLYCSKGSIKHFKLKKTFKYLALIAVFSLLGFWHYFSYFLGFFLIILFFITQKETLKLGDQTRRRSLKSKILNNLSVICITLILIIALNIWVMISSKARGQVGNYFYSSLSSLKIIEVLGDLISPYSRTFLIVIEASLLLFIFVVGVIIKKLITIIARNKDSLTSVLNVKIYLLFSTIAIGISSAIYIGYSKNIVGGLNTTQNLGILSYLAILGLLFFVFNVLIYPLIARKGNILLNSFYILFTQLTLIFAYLIVKDIYNRISQIEGTDTFSSTIRIINELSYRLIPYIIFFGCMFFMFYEKYFVRLSEYIRKISVHISTYVFRKLKIKNNGKRRVFNFKKLASTRNLTVIFIFLFSIQSIAFSPWQIYHSELNLPEDDLYLVSKWLRYNLDQTTEFIFVEYMYRSIAAYSFLNVPNLEEKAADIILGMYYQRDLELVINILSNFSCFYFIFDLVGLDAEFMTKIARDKYLISFYNIDPEVLECYNDSIPVNEEILTVFSTDTLLVLKII